LQRRTFIQSSLLLIASSSLYLNAFSYSQSRQQIDLYELLGLKEPDLCGDSFCLRNEVFEAFHRMVAAAEKDGLKLWASSGYRSFEYQKGIWNNKFTTFKKAQPKLNCIEIIGKITEYSSIPGTSRHHWGTEIDIVDAFGYHSESPLSRENFENNGIYRYLGKWLTENAGTYGFIQTYTDDHDRTGFAYEPWHYSYAPLSVDFFRAFQNIDLLSIPEIKKCKGIECIDKVFLERYFKTYVSGINPALQ
jgi:LAS superfamily LD-carboxypeptidase LdcB